MAALIAKTDPTRFSNHAKGSDLAFFICEVKMSKMKNKAAAIFANPIPYCKALRKVTGSVTGAILMQQLEYWFHQKPDGFYKYLEPLKGSEGKLTKYKEGDSWVEELGFSKDEFRAAFDKIGHRFKSKKDMKENLSQSATRLYYSYFDKMKGETWYFRNHEVVDKKLDDLIYGDRETQFTDMGKPDAPVSGNPTPNITETTTKTTTENTAAAALWVPRPREVRTETNKKTLKKVDFSSIQEVVDILKPVEPYIEKAISHTTKYLIESCIENDGLEFVLSAVRGRNIEAEQKAKITGKPKDLALWTFFGAESGDWRVKCVKIWEAQQNAPQGLESGFKSTLPDFSHIKYDDAPIDEEAWQTFANSSN